MLYVSTRNPFDAYTVSHAIREAVAPDGGLFLPFRFPQWDAQTLEAMTKVSFGQCVADVLNTFFSGNLSGWDVEVAIGRHAVKSVPIGGRMVIGELWHNLAHSFDHVEQALARKVTSKDAKAAGWVRIAVRMAVLTGLWAQLVRKEITDLQKKMDLSLVSGDFSMVMAAWYLRKMGLPIGDIICSCNDNSGVWDLLCQGEFYTGAVTEHTATPLADTALPQELERLICSALSPAEAKRFADICQEGGIYEPRPGMLEALRAGMTAAVIGDERLIGTIGSAYRTNGYLMGPYTALSYAGVMDHRSNTAERRLTLLLAERSPVLDSALVCQATGLTKEQLGASFT